MSTARRTALARAALAVTVAGLAATAPAAAHSSGLSFGSYAWRGGQVEASLAFALRELAGALPRAVVGDGSWVALLANEKEATAWIRDRLSVSADAAVCPARSTAMRVDGDGVVFDLVFACVATDDAADVERLSVAAPFLHELPAGHRHVLKLARSGAEVDAILTALDPAVTVELGDHARVSGWALAAGAFIVAAGLGGSIVARRRASRR